VGPSAREPILTQPTLHRHVIADGGHDRWLYVLHGIFGAGRNWATLARRLAGARPDWGVILVDLRLHGHSQGFEPPHTLAACVHDLGELARSIDRRAGAVLGHSFGGKVALMTAPALHPAQVWVVDSTPSRRTPGGSAVRMLEALERLPSRFPDRAACVEALEREGFARHVAQWMATNLVPADGELVWRFDLGGLESLLGDFFRRDLWDVVASPPRGTEIHLVRATESDVLSDADMERIRSAGDGTFAHELHGGHWLHVDNLEGLLELLARRLPGA